MTCSKISKVILHPSIQSVVKIVGNSTVAADRRGRRQMENVGALRGRDRQEVGLTAVVRSCLQPGCYSYLKRYKN